MSILDTPLFSEYYTLGAGFHNIGSGVLRASDPKMIKKIEAHYGERCGHIPLTATEAYLLVDDITPNIEHQVAYLGQLFHKELHAISFAAFAQRQHELGNPPTLVVPYINVPETEEHIRTQLRNTDVWGLPSSMVDLLKNKARFYEFAQEVQLPDFSIPEYTVAPVTNVVQASLKLLKQSEELYQQAGLADVYPLGVMIRAAESDGNYGCSLLHSEGERIVIVQDGDSTRPLYETDWQRALEIAERQLRSAMNVEREERVVISRYIDIEDSPGLSLVLLDGQSASLGWNGQLQLEGSLACVGTSTYLPKNTYLSRLQLDYEEKTASNLQLLLQKVAEQCGEDFASIRGIANLDTIVPGALERRLQQRLNRPQIPYLAECNPRWTNYTDAILAVLGASGRTATVANMRAVIQEGIFTIDKHLLPTHLDPALLRSCINEQDEQLSQLGIKIICRMTTNPMGLILTGDRIQARAQLEQIVDSLAGIS